MLVIVLVVGWREDQRNSCDNGVSSLSWIKHQLPGDVACVQKNWGYRYKEKKKESASIRIIFFVFDRPVVFCGQRTVGHLFFSFEPCCWWEIAGADWLVFAPSESTGEFKIFIFVFDYLVVIAGVSRPGLAMSYLFIGRSFVGEAGRA